MKKNPLGCPKCEMPFTPKGLLELFEFYYPENNWIRFKCPGCKETFMTTVRNGAVTIGEIDGAPGPCFFPLRRCAIPGLKIVQANDDLVSLQYRSFRRRVPAKK